MIGRHMTKLKDRPERFCQEYLKHLNGTKAAMDAGYSENGAEVRAHELLRNSKIQMRIQELMEDRSVRTEVTQDEVLLELKKVAFFDISKAYDEEGNLLSVHEMPEETRKAIAGIEVFTELDYGSDKDQVGDDIKKIVGKTKKLKLNDKLKALEMLGRHLKLFTDKVEHSGSVYDNMTNEELKKRLDEIRKKKKA